MRDLIVGDKVRLLTNVLEKEDDSRALTKKYSVVTVDSINGIGKGYVTIRTIRGLKRDLGTKHLELVRDTDLGLEDVISKIRNGELEKEAIVNIGEETFKVFADSDGLGLIQLGTSVYNVNEDLLHIPSRYISRGFVVKPKEDKVMKVSLQDLELKYNSKIEMTK